MTFEYSSDGKLLKRSDGLEFIYDLQGVAGVVDNSGSTAKTYFYRKDAQGNIVALLDENGAVVAKYVYNAWGEHKVLAADGVENTSASFIGNLNPFRYRGYYYDKALKLYYLVTRYYDPVVGRFISQDALDYADPDTINGLNLYAYCNNNPVMNVDPTGTWWWDVFWNVVSAIVGAVVGVVVGVVVTAVAGPVAGIAAGIATGALVFSGVNNIVNAVYYNFISDGKSDLSPNSYSGNNGDIVKYHSRWERLDYTKAMTGDKYYGLNAWRYFSEYSFRMYAWMPLHKFYTGKQNDGFLSYLAGSAVEATVEPHSWERKNGKWSWRNIVYILFGLLGI